MPKPSERPDYEFYYLLTMAAHTGSCPEMGPFVLLRSPAYAHEVTTSFTSLPWFSFSLYSDFFIKRNKEKYGGKKAQKLKKKTLEINYTLIK